MGSGLIAFQAGGTKRLNLDPEVSGSLPAHDGKQTGRKGRLAAVETKPADTDPPPVEPGPPVLSLFLSSASAGLLGLEPGSAGVRHVPALSGRGPQFITHPTR